jgi:transketolase
MQSFDKPLSRNDIATIRRRLLQMHFESGVGHIGGNLSALDAMLVVFHEYLDAGDTFILSKGHSAGALYSTLWSVGKLTDDDLKQFHKDDTLLAGHPPASGIPDIPFATGSLGHGLSLAAGTALGLRLRGSASHVYCLMSDGEWQEGSTWEALIFATHHRLTNLTILVDHNKLQGFGTTTSVASMAPLAAKLGGFEVDVSEIDGHDAAHIRSALSAETSRPHVIILDTKKGSGVSFMEGRMEWHYLPLNGDQYSIALEELKNT